MEKRRRFVRTLRLSLAVMLGLWAAGPLPAAFAQPADEAAVEPAESPDGDEATAEPGLLTVNSDAVRLNFEGADIREVIHTIAATLGIHYIIDPRVQGQVTIRTASDIPRDELLPMFHQIFAQQRGVGQPG